VLTILAIEIVVLAILMAIESTRYSIRIIPDKENPGSYEQVSLINHVKPMIY